MWWHQPRSSLCDSRILLIRVVMWVVTLACGRRCSGPVSSRCLVSHDEANRVDLS